MLFNSYGHRAHPCGPGFNFQQRNGVSKLTVRTRLVFCDQKLFFESHFNSTLCELESVLKKAIAIILLIQAEQYMSKWVLCFADAHFGSLIQLRNVCVKRFMEVWKYTQVPLSGRCTAKFLRGAFSKRNFVTPYFYSRNTIIIDFDNLRIFIWNESDGNDLVWNYSMLNENQRKMNKKGALIIAIKALDISARRVSLHLDRAFTSP